MRIHETVREDIVIIKPEGRLTVETEAHLREAVWRLIDAGRTHLVLNLAEVPHMDNAGLGAIAEMYVCARRRGGDLKLVNVSGRNHQLLTITNLLTVLETYDSEDNVERSFARDSRELLT